MQRDKALLGLALAALLTLGPVEAQAKVVSGAVRVPTCVTATVAAKNCTVTGFLNQRVGGGNSDFIGAPDVDRGRDRAQEP